MLSDPDYRASLKNAWGPVRVCMAVEQEYGQEKLADLYTAIGTEWHVHGRREDAMADLGAFLAECLATADLYQAFAARERKFGGLPSSSN